MNTKPGGGNKPQPYIPAGNGDKSGEYTNKPKTVIKKQVTHCHIRNEINKCNFKGSKLVGKVNNYIISKEGMHIPSHCTPNTVVKKIVGGYVVSERFYDSDGNAYLDIDYTCHGLPNVHPEVPHIHMWKKDEKGILRRNKWESFK